MLKLRSVMLLLALLTFAYRASAQAVVPLSSGEKAVEIQLVQWAVTQGGLVVVVLVIMWSYRRDFQKIFMAERERTTELIMALQGASSALAVHAEVMRDNALASREQAKAFLELSGSVKLCEAVRDVFQERKKSE